ncbi:DUF6809 family protein [Paenibacillus graminis]|uniref:DUF6809 family protein n=1 Tax=Paenibacillus graminis TaxID=189425 RepID=UPI002DBCBF27|nr:DUF6809 family protein [Paenibacillus graminis]
MIYSVKRIPLQRLQGDFKRKYLSRCKGYLTDPEYRPLNRKITEAAGNWTTRLMEQEFEELEDLLYLCAQSDSLQTRAAFQNGRSGAENPTIHRSYGLSLF